jgi:thiosulfate/3-mercaptopyruvate sulfurtransferase
MTAPVESRGYAHGDVLVSTDWVADRLTDPSVRVIESNEDMLLYPSGHVPGAVQVDWAADLNDQLRRDYLSRQEFEAGIAQRHHARHDCGLHGDKNNWWAVMPSGLSVVRPHAGEGHGRRTEATGLEVPGARAQDATARSAMGPGAHPRQGPWWTRSPDGFGERPDHHQRAGGYIPRTYPARAINSGDGSFKNAAELRDIYLQEQALKSAEPTIAYCRIGERSSHTWFVLKYLLGFTNVRNYDGSWTEWGNLVGAPIEKSSGEQSQKTEDGRQKTEDRSRRQSLIPDDAACWFPARRSTFALVGDPADRANLLISFADQFKPVPPEVATPPYPKDHLVPYCESEAYVWLVLQDDGTATLHFAVENPSGVSAKALAAILTSTLSGLPPEVIEQVSPDIVPQIFRQNISMGKASA